MSDPQRPRRPSARRGRPASGPSDGSGEARSSQAPRAEPKRASAVVPSTAPAAAKKPSQPAARAKRPASKIVKPTKAVGTEPPPSKRWVGLEGDAPEAPPDAAPPARRPSARRKPLAPSVVPPEPSPAVPPSSPSDPDAPSAGEDLYSIQSDLDRLLREADSITGDPAARRRAAEALTAIAARLGGADGAVPPADEGLLEGARELFSPDYYLRQWSRLGLLNRSEEVDDFGLDPTYEAKLAPLFEALYRKWFRVTVEGVGHVPAQGRCMIVANHGGALPWDGLMLRTAIRLEHPSGRRARWLAEDYVYHMPFAGAFLARVGGVRACPENAERLLAQDELLAVFPEGIKGVSKLFKKRYELQRFGRGGHIKLALKTGSSVVPAGIVGAEEAYPMLLRSQRAAKVVGLPFLPVTPTFPWLGPLGLVPLPSRWVIVLGEPLDLSEHGPDSANDAVLVQRVNEQLRARVQDLVARALSLRGERVFF